MMQIVLLIGILSVFVPVLGYTDHSVRRFKDGFLFGAASAAYQVEGAWNEDGKGPSIWDQHFHGNPDKDVVAPGDMASDSYHNYKRDVEMLRELGVDFYRFSISWPRILPNGFSNIKNEPGLQYYDNLIDELIKHNIQPMVTLYHFDLPAVLQELGGWANPYSVEWFEEYARVVFDRYASKVKYWITMNQPNSICEVHNFENLAPKSTRGVYDYMCAKNVLLSHARAYRLYEKEYKKYGGSVGISVSVNWADPLTNGTEDVASAERFREFSYGMYLNPILSKSGDFPKLVKERVARKSKEQGFLKSRLPALSKDEVKLIKGSADFLGVNHYTTFLVSPSTSDVTSPSFEDDLGVELTTRAEWVQSHSTWLKSAPYGLYKACLHLNKLYDYPPIIITENGWSTDRGLKDSSRSEYIQQYLKALLLGIEDGTDVRGYAHWSLMDNVEWIGGTSERFGLYEVDFDSPERTRTARESALVYKRIIQKRIVEEGWRPKSLKISIKDKKTSKTEL